MVETIIQTHRIKQIMRIPWLAKTVNCVSREQHGELEQNEWLGVGYSSRGINTSDGLGKIHGSVNLGNLLSGNSPRIATDAGKKEIGRKIPSSKHYIVYREAAHGQRIRTMTCGARLAGPGVGKWRLPGNPPH